MIATYKLTHNIGANGGVQTVYGADVDATGKVTKKTGAFMESHNVNAIEFTITDFEGKQIANNVTLSLKKEMSTTKANGGYTYEAASTVEETPITITSADNITFKGNALSLKIAGDYVPTATITLKDGTEIKYDKFPTLSVYSVKPSVTVTGVSGGGNTKLTWKQKSGTGYKRLEYAFSEPKTNETDGFEVTVYAVASENGEGCGTGDAGFTRPTLKFKASGVSESATVKFTIPAGDAAAINVTLNGTTESSEIKLGSIKQVKSLDGYRAFVIPVTYTVFGYKGHGEQKIETVTITQGGVAYTVTLDNPIVIKNPSSIDQTS